MPLNLLKKYNTLLEILHFPERERNQSLKGIFNRDIKDNTNFTFRTKNIKPTTADGEIPLDTLFTHLTTEIVDQKTRKRAFEGDRSVRLHWVRFHLEEQKKGNTLIFSCIDPDGKRTYIYDQDEKYVVILEPHRSGNEYYLITAYYVRGGNQRKMENKYKRRLPDLL